MEHFNGTEGIGRSLVRPVLTVGNFDGVHVGHRAILDTVVARARALEGEAVVHTFEPHPRKVLRPERAPRLLTTLEQKLELLGEIGVDLVIVEPFTRDLATLPAERFVREVVFERLEPVEVYVGYDFRVTSFLLRLQLMVLMVKVMLLVQLLMVFLCLGLKRKGLIQIVI